MTDDNNRAYVDRQIAELRNTLQPQLANLFEKIARLREEVQALRLRNERLESVGRRV
jgi:protein-arginine kinase activator protein McsA